MLEVASIEGRTFHRRAVTEPHGDALPGDLDVHLAALIRRELIHPVRPDIEGEEGFRFSHILIRDAAYALIPKQRRAALHEQHARWLERRAGRSRPASIRPSTAWVSRTAASGGTAGFTGPWTVTTERGPMNWSSST